MQKDCIQYLKWSRYYRNLENPELTFRTMKDLEEYEIELVESELGTRNVCVEDLSEETDEEPILFFYRDPVEAITTLFGNSENRECFEEYYNDERNANDEQIFSTPNTGLFWKEMHDLLVTQGHRQESVIAALIFYSDQTTLTQDWRKKAWPIYMHVNGEHLLGKQKKISWTSTTWFDPYFKR
jgi:Plavaka transposase